MNTAIAFFVFNRPTQTAQVFAKIAKAKPANLLLVADGPRNEAEAARCAEVREIISRIDWPCRTLTNFSDINLGCKKRVQSGLDWVFEQCEEAIIIEDDCLPHPDYFKFCSELLERYRDKPQIAFICGTNYGVPTKTNDSYAFSHFPLSGSWASWRRYWRDTYDRQMAGWPDRGERWLQSISDGKRFAPFCFDHFQRTYTGEIDTWDYQNWYTIWRDNLLTIAPTQNLISNIGFHAEATHTLNEASPMSCVSLGASPFPLRHPSKIKRNRGYDRRLFRFLSSADDAPLASRIYWQLANMTPAPVWAGARKLKRLITKS
jgi:hypothetical protein